MAELNINRVKSSDIEFKDRLVAINRVTKVTKGGRTFTFAAIVVIGNENGVVGYGLGKAKEVQAAVQKGVDDAKKNLIRVPVLKGTIPHEQIGKYSGAKVFLKPAAPGTGIIAGGVVRSIIGLTGIKNLISKSLGSTNKANIAYAVMEGLKQQVPKSEWNGAKKTAPKAEKAEKAEKSAKKEDK